MQLQNVPHIEEQIARCRLFLSVAAIVAVFADPTRPFVSEWLPINTGRFAFDPYVMGVMSLHLLYSAGSYLAVSRRWFPQDILSVVTMSADVLLGAAIALMTEGTTSPFYSFFAFAVVVAGLRAGMRQAMVVTVVSVAFYLALIVISAPGGINEYIMRPAYLAIVGYLVGYLGQQRIELQAELHRLESSKQRQRIARDLHDGFAQALAGINLRIEGCRRLLRHGDGSAALAELTDLQGSVHREYDELRTYMYTLAGMRASPAPIVADPATRVSLRVDMEASIELMDHVLQITREGMSNVRRHAAARSARIDVTADGAKVRISLDDDGVGLPEDTAPWSIVSRVSEMGGELRLANSGLPGCHMQIELPQA